MSASLTRSGTPSTSELVEGVLFHPIALVVSATIFPGFTLCIPGLLVVTVLVLIPVVALALVAVVVAAVVAAPVVLVRAVRGLLAGSPRTSRRLAGWKPVKIGG